MNKNITTVIIVLAIVIAGIVIWKAMTRETTDIAAEQNQPLDAEHQPTTMTEVTKEDIKVGTGAEAKTGNTVTVHYVGTFPNGTKFDSSRDRGEPFSFRLGGGQVIRGWDQGVVGMKEGGVRKLTIPPELGYGPNDYGPIPGGSTLVFEVELLKVQ